METRWGYRIAVRANEKCRKACIRASRRGCLLHDRSYYEVLCVATAALGQLAPLLHPDDLKRLEASAVSATSQATPLSAISLSLYDDAPTTDQHLVGPAEIIVGPTVTAILVHPCIGSTVAASLTAMGVSVEVHRGEWAIFDLQGPQAEQLLHQLVKYHRAAACPASQVECGWALDPRLAAGVDAEVAAALIREAGDIGEFWNCNFQRSHAASRNSSHQLDQRRAQLAVPGTKLTPTRQDPLMPFLLLRPSSPEAVPRISLIVHEQWGLFLWRALVFAQGTRFAGLDELGAVNLEALRPTFPQDFPMAPGAFAHHLDIYAARLEDKWKRTPPAKRTNYQKLGITSPFRLDLSLLPVESAPLHLCRIEMGGRGTPEYNARVYREGRLIGFVTSGGYSQVCGKGIGFATCRLAELDLAARLSVEIQSINSTGTRPALLTKVDT